MCNQMLTSMYYKRLVNSLKNEYTVCVVLELDLLVIFYSLLVLLYSILIILFSSSLTGSIL